MKVAPAHAPPGVADRRDPVDAMFRLSASYVEARATWLFAKLGLADALAGVERGPGEVAQELGLHREAVGRLLRVLEPCGLVERTAFGGYRLTEFGSLLTSDDPRSMRSWVTMTGGPIFEAFRELEWSLRTGEPAFERVHGARMYDHLSAHPADAEAFQAAMRAYGAQAAAALLETCRFRSGELVVDVGAGPGTVLLAVLAEHDGCRGVLFDLPAVARLAESALSPEQRARCRVIGGDFFESVPEGGDAYLLCSILHNWSDPEALEILRSCRRAMSRDARLLVAEILVPPDPGPHFGKTTDLVMLVAAGGRERTAEEIGGLLRCAGFRARPPKPSALLMSVIEAEPADPSQGRGGV